MIEEKIETAFDAFENGEVQQAYRLFDEMKSELETGHDDYSTYQHALGYLYIADQKFDEAREHYLAMLEDAEADERPSILHQLGTVEQLDSEFSQAEDYFRQEAACLSDDDHAAMAANYYAHGYTMMLSGDYRTALRLLQQSLEKADDDIRAHAERALGELFAAQNDMTQARDHFTAAKKHFRASGDHLGAEEIEMLESIIFE
ncbi:tetratricopeptide repeat protein [Macrococcus carouselicus]|uniref:Tetratricopeptide repeat protein n=1 Tax=Macrococcus carouselicus TaxID=69969 RepID=A0A9Q8FQK8_9STAP|nr:hypothetical protein [Macrococcus carouselicus]TDM02507.1 hypothetical protein ERX40_08100 [Macrococcus carouselicus]